MMNIIGLIGGMSAESTREYYRVINDLVASRLGGSHSARLVLYSVDFDDVERLQRAGAWDQLDEQMVDAARALDRAGAQCVLICANTMHKCAPAVESSVAIPLIHIADATGHAIVQGGSKRVGLLGTRYTMEGDFYSGRLHERFGIETLIPDDAERTAAHDIIYTELIHGIVSEKSRATYAAIIEHLVGRGAEAIVLACTELMLLIKPEDSTVPLHDTMAIHAQAAADFALA